LPGQTESAASRPSRNGIEVLAAQEANVVRVFQLVEIRWVTSELLIEAANGKCILLAAANQLAFFLSLNGFGCSWSRCSESDDQQGQREQNGQQHVAVLPARLPC